MKIWSKCFNTAYGQLVEKMNKPLVSIILTTYDRPDYLLRALQSVVDQTYKNLEILVVDGKGLQITKDVVAKFKLIDDRIIHWSTEARNKTTIYGNVQNARNFGLKQARGKYVAMLDDDDIWRADKIEFQVFFAEIHNAALTSCYMKIYGSNHIDKPSIHPNYKDLLKNFNMSCTSSYFLNREVLKSIGGFNENLRSMHEYDIALKLAKKGFKIGVVPLPLMTMNRDNAKERSFYFIKVAEVLDLYRLYGKDMWKYLGVRGFLFNVMKSSLLVSLFLAGYLIKDKVWKIIFKLKNMYQEKSE